MNMLFALVLFILTYVLMIALPKFRPWTALCSAVLFVCFGFVSPRELPDAIDWNVLLMLTGTMGTVSLFIGSKMPSRIAEILLEHSHSVMWAAVAMSLFAGIVSAFIDNVATVLMVAPVGLAVCRKLGVPPVPMIISIAVSSHLQGAAPLVGDTTSILLGGYANLDFLDFFFLDGKPSIFFAVELGALVTIPVILMLFRKERGIVHIQDRTCVSDLFPSFLLIANVALLILASFIENKPPVTNGLLCIAIFALGAVRALLRKETNAVRTALREIDFQTLLLLAGLFVVIQGVSNAGLIDKLSQIFVRVGDDNLFLLYTVIVWGSVLISAFVDNIPYVATMLPVIQGVCQTMGHSPTLLYFGLLVGATLGGNLTPIGASANITAIGILRREGYSVSLRDFMRIGVPFTLCAVFTGFLYCWFVFA